MKKRKRKISLERIAKTVRLRDRNGDLKHWDSDYVKVLSNEIDRAKAEGARNGKSTDGD